MNTPERWLATAVADAKARGHEGAVPVLEAFARVMHVLRSADWNDTGATRAEEPGFGASRRDAPGSDAPHAHRMQP